MVVTETGRELIKSSSSKTSRSVETPEASKLTDDQRFVAALEGLMPELSRSTRAIEVRKAMYDQAIGGPSEFPLRARRSILN